MKSVESSTRKQINGILRERERLIRFSDGIAIPLSIDEHRSLIVVRKLPILLNLFGIQEIELDDGRSFRRHGRRVDPAPESPARLYVRKLVQNALARRGK